LPGLVYAILLFLTGARITATVISRIVRVSLVRPIVVNLLVCRTSWVTLVGFVIRVSAVHGWFSSRLVKGDASLFL
jgi:hypothetical protein